MDQGELADTAPQGPRSVGDRLRQAREAQGLDLGEVAQRTRVPQRHLEAIERGDYNALPATTYAMGFAKAYARTVGVDTAELGRDLRAELSQTYSRPVREIYEASDPRRMPGPGVGLFYGTDLFRTSDAPPAPTVAEAEPTPAPVATPAPPASGGQVTLTATDEVWVRVYDSAGTTLLMKTMQAGEQYDVPPTASNPMINTGRADQIEVRVNGSIVAPLGDGRRSIQNVGVGAEALQARGASSTTPAPATAANPG
jgi:cytoskeleton protein RodZ